jgi:hypothetical protein
MSEIYRKVPVNTCFINYRTKNGENVATLIKHDLSVRFGEAEVFFASESIGAGRDFVREIERALNRCEVLLAVIGPDWKDFPGSNGGRAIEEPSDWTRREIATVLAAGKPVVPVLFDNAPRLRENDLPTDIRALARCQYRRFNHRNAKSDLEQIAEAVLVVAPHLERPEAPETRAGQEHTSNSMRDVSGLGVQSREFSNHGVAGVGGNVGSIVTGSSGPVNSGGGTQYNGSPVHHGTGDQNNGSRFITDGEQC